MESENPTDHINNQYLSVFSIRNFRLYFAGQLISITGTWMQRVAQSWLVFNLTQSEWWLGVVVGISGLSMLITAPMAGVLVDRFPRRQLLITAQAVEMVLALLLAYLAFTNTVQVEHIVILACCLGLTTAVGDPARRTLLNDIVGKSGIAAGLSLNATMTNMAAVIGPVLAGVALLRWGAAVCFLFNGLSYGAVIGSLFFMRVVSGGKTAVSHPHLLRQIQEGIRYVRRERSIAVQLLTVTISGALGIGMVQVLLPAYASKILEQPVTGLALLSAALGFGSITASLGNVWMGRRFGQKQLVRLWALALPLGSLLLSQIKSLPFAIILMGIMGFGYTVLFVTSNVLIQLEVDDAYRGRVLSLWSMNRFGITPITALAIGGIAQTMGISAALWSCGLLAFASCYWLNTKKQITI